MLAFTQAPSRFAIMFYDYLFSRDYGGAIDFALALLPWRLLMELCMQQKGKDLAQMPPPACDS